ncbi:MAG: ABC transporter permease [Firmicutes bacterium]|nr:ABC transporter permease [Bacillota bacterium]
MIIFKFGKGVEARYATGQRADARFFKIREDLGTVPQIILGLLPILLIFLVWYLLTHGKHENRIISPLILPSPYEVLTSLKTLWFEAELSRSIVASAGRVILGFFTGLLVAFPLGIFMGSFTKVKAMFNPLMTFAAYLPIPALLPLTMSLFGIGELQKMMFLALAFIIYLLPLFVKALDEVDNIYLQTAYTLGATNWQTMRHVLLGVALPKIFHAMRLGFGVGWTYIILAEMVAAERGLGQIIIVAQRRGPREHIYLVLVVIVLIAYLTDKLWMKLSRSLFPYLEEKR